MRRESRIWLVMLAVGIFAAMGCGEQQPVADGDVEAATATQELTAVKVPQGVAAGAYHSLFLRKDGTVWAWGQNVAGQVGTGSASSTPVSQPTQVNGLPAIKALAAGIAHSLALDVSGNVWAWGQNASGQAGLGSAGGTVLVPTKVTALSGIQAIAANGNFSLALGTDGRLWAWGQNASGQVGTGATSASVSTPAVVTALPTIRSMAAGVNHVLALDAEGRVWGWGLNTSAQVGTGATSTTVLTPVQVAGLPRATAVAAGAGHSLIVDEQFGNVWAWGQNTFGQVGTGSASSTPVLAPTPVSGVFAVTALVAGHNSSLAIIGNGFATAWGHNAAGQLGTGTTVNSASPVGVTGLADAKALAAGAQHALALRPGCPMWAWGNNSQGQLGTGSTSSTPVTAPAQALLVNTFYFDGDMDGFGDEYLSEQACEPSPGYVEEVDCDDYTAATYPGAPESCNGMDDNCDGAVDDGNPSGGENCSTGQPGVCAAGVTACTNASVVCQQRQAASAEQCDGLDNDCDGAVDDGNPGGLQACATGQQGVCGEGVTYCTHGALECAPTRGASSEVCDGADNDCDGQVDDELAFQAWYRDVDGDNYGLTSQSVQACSRPSGYAPNSGDCNDTSAVFHPGAVEACDGVDNDCDAQADEGVPTQAWYRDADGDGTGNVSNTLQNCRQPAGFVSDASDCDDSNAAIKPGGTEVCDALDNDCDAQVDEGVLSAWYRDADGDGFGDAAQSTQACGKPTGYVAVANDCNDTSAAIKPGAAEVCDGVDNNCSGAVDEGIALLTWYRDVDGDTYGTSTNTLQKCSQPVGYVSAANDCDDSSAAIKPGATEVSDGVDNNCNGAVDEGFPAGITVSAPNGSTTEAGGQATFTVVLNAQPTGNVTVHFDSNDTREGTVATKSLTFTPANWKAPQTVTIAGVDDALADGNQPYAIVFSATTSSDAAYAAVTPTNVNLTNTDDDSVGFAVTDISGPTNEFGGPAIFTVRLTSQPFADVTVNFDSNDTTEGTVSPKSFTFTPSNWTTPQKATITGVDDDFPDGNQSYSIVFSATTGSDATYATIRPGDINVINLVDSARRFGFIDTHTNDVGFHELYDFFAGAGPVSSDFIFVELTNGGAFGGAWCSENARWYADQYMALAVSGGSPVSGSWNKYARPGPSGSPWYGPTTTGYVNIFGSECASYAWGWCSEWGINGMHFIISPADADPECYADGWSPGPAGWPRVTIRIASTRAMACGF
ncbi:MopE-related protein [Pyxidicoccus caerfyrddinensis]|uniref:RCC1 domain-containing protein n=1 Tax=Pyxidicoccus caerfyrddinensis TaxID=2709663 RepID=UPI0013DAE767|nr:MopE-related protein [Pyxidicoccus caerfyrddinensis]